MREFKQSTAIQALAIRVIIQAEANAALMLEASIEDAEYARRLKDLHEVQALMRAGYQRHPEYDARGRKITDSHLRLVRTEGDP